MRAIKKKSGAKDEIQAPNFYIFPTDVIEKYRKEGKWKKIRITDIPDYESYEEIPKEKKKK